MNKKILTTGLAIGATLSGTPSTTILGYYYTNINNINSSNELNIRMNYRDLNNLGYEEYDRIVGGHSQTFFRDGFQAFYDPKRNRMAYGYVFDITKDKFKLKTGFFTINGRLYHSNPYGYSSVGLTNIDGKLYYFDEHKTDPHAVRGWKDANNQKLFFDTTFTAKKNGIYQIVDGGYYYFDKQGYLQLGLKEIDKNIYSFTGSGGRALLGWNNIGNRRYYFDRDRQGAAMQGWYRDRGTNRMVYFFEEDGRRGVMAVGIVDIPNDGIYLLKKPKNSENAYRTTGFYTDFHTTTRDRYYFNPNRNGRAHTGWHTYEGKRMYFYEDKDRMGVMAKGIVNIPGEGMYLFKDNSNDWNAYLTTGWYNDPITKKTYYFDKDHDGKAAMNTMKKIGRTRYYFGKDGSLVRVEN